MNRTFSPFKAWTYNLEKVGGLAGVVTPPYDVITPEMQNAFYAANPHNFCRVDFAREEAPQRYEIAAETLREWEQNGVVMRDAQPALYFHVHDFRLPDGRAVARHGFFAARRLESFAEGGVKPHEKTLDAPKRDRLELMRATHRQLSPVFALYSDPEGVIAETASRSLKTTPAFDFTAEDGERHRLWKIRDESVWNAVEKTLAGRPSFIADGHHRYETALNYRDELLAKNPDLPENAAARRVLMYFSRMEDPGLVILPIHRALKGLAGFDWDKFLSDLQTAGFVLRDASPEDPENQLSEAGRNAHAFLVVGPGGKNAKLATIAREKWLAAPAAQNLPGSVATLDVALLHRFVFQEILGLSEESQARQDNIVYWKSTARALEETASGECQITFLLNPTRIGDMREVALAGHKMPQKSTYFYPKIVSGLLWREAGADADF